MKLNDLMWDGKYKIYQNENLFKLSIDSILLSYFVSLGKKTKNILDIGTGNAPIPIILTKRTNAKIYGVEIQKKSYELAKKNIEMNNLENKIILINDDIKKLYESLENNFFDTIVCNPPYFKCNTKFTNNKSRKLARNEFSLTLNDIFLISKKILKDKGNIAIINRTERLAEIIFLMKNNSIEPKKIQFVHTKKENESKLVLIEGTKNGNPGLKCYPPLIIQDDKNLYTNQIQQILLGKKSDTL